MEPERKIEKLLRAYAKKRQGDAGDPLKLHPAMRRQLQDEVARRKRQPEDEEEASVSLWELFKQRWALLAGFALICFFGAALFLPAMNKAKNKAESVTAMSNLKQIGVAAQMAANDNYGKLPASLELLTNELGSDKVLTDPQSGQPFVYVAGGEKLDALSSNAVLAYSPMEKKGRAVLFADGRVEVVNGARLNELTSRSSTPLLAASDSIVRKVAESPAPTEVANGYATAAGAVTVQPKTEAGRSDTTLADTGNPAASSGFLAVNKPAPATPPSGRMARSAVTGDRDFKTQENAIEYANTVSPNSGASLQSSFKNTVAQTKAPAVLANFAVQQNGNAIRVVDADGSVYDGELLPEKSFAQSEPAVDLPAAPTITATPLKDQVKLKTAAARDESQAAQNYFFQVSGTNVTLQQKVVFAGNLVANSSAQRNRQQTLSGGIGGALTQAALTNQLPWSESRIEGTAVVADTNHIEINAVPQAP